MDLKQRLSSFRRSSIEKILTPQENQAKIDEVRKIIGPVASKFPVMCSDASIQRYLRARKNNSKKAAKMLKCSLKWRLEYKPEMIKWDDIAQEGALGRLYKADYLDSQGRTVLVMRPAITSASAAAGQIKYLVYCLENAIMTLSSKQQEQMVWLVDFQGWNKSCISLKITRETAQILQDHYPERLGLAVMYNPPKVFESFWTMVKPFLEPKTFKKVIFAYPDNTKSLRMMEELFDKDKLESYFGGRNTVGWTLESFSKKMKDDDNKRMSKVSEGGVSTELINESIQIDDNNSDDETSSCDTLGSTMGEDKEEINVQERLDSPKPTILQKDESGAKP
ncbi:uncharacterized protein LOC130936190 [Arachis stenosperma]|uniref:uncharacterized protein LOC130936190 n=1 Tax=Arachis stenosperma TaxID=217475 RepID=UPI0025AD0B08|nr:uncharacterized protein LOC130936190 [Arachis stenosperma]XP_057722207.1 uncharacterized protein LOC130936190 [Arachis stenosperma]XP_057722208.1 uncharacterized protein LOC130936190 [Arachis stenosperma]XP_057722209.1 uncharacterized protein LOC130936190 [Arachis stenosperma]